MQEDKNSEINYWPYAILGMILTVVVLGIWTIKVAISNPVQLDRSYMMSYQEVDDNINKIMAMQKKFDSKYVINFNKNILHIGKNRVVLNIKDKDGNIVKNGEIVAIVTRQTTSQYDIHLKNFRLKDSNYESEEFQLKSGGRWNIEVKVKIGEDIGYKTYKTFVK